MIKNERQYRITKAQLDRFEAALSEASPVSVDVDPRLKDIERLAIQSQVADLKAELSEYEALRCTSAHPRVTLHSIS